ncbi:hypothetical protein HN662_00030 [Candidatus Woesearchaeota archaeon]|nr:hypothetical protein [Candidatus Woesearchaeota archaeon]
MTRIEIVKTSDHICNTLRCPYQPLCSSGRSREVGQQIIAKLEDRCPDSARKEIERGAKGHSKDLNLQDRLPYGLKTTFRDLKARMEAP